MTPWTAVPRAGAAEAARSLLRTATTVALHLPDVPGLVAVGGHAADATGRLLLPTSLDDPVVAALRGARGLPARAVLTDVAPLPVRERWRGRLEIAGLLASVPPDDADDAWRWASGQSLPPGRCLLRLAPRALVLSRCPDAPVPVCPQEHAQARPDPVAPLEAELLSHLVHAHDVALDALLPRRVTAGARRVVPLRLDRHALVLRVERERDHVDVALALASARAQHPGEVVAALRALLDTCPRTTGRR